MSSNTVALMNAKEIADKFESQEIKINELSKIVDMLMVGQVTSWGSCRETTRAIGEIMTYGNGWAPENNKQWITNGTLSKDGYGINKMAGEIVEAKKKEIKENERKAQSEIVRLQVEAQELAEAKEKAMKDMMARVALLEETAKKEEDELDNLKLLCDPKTDEEIDDYDPKIQELLMREANALARAAEMRAEKWVKFGYINLR